MAPYTKRFYAHNQASSKESAQQIVSLVMKLMSPRQPNRVVDFGCGIGTWLCVFKENNVAETIGVDGDWVPQENLLIQKDDFIKADLRRLPSLDTHFDLVVSLEVAEHLPSENAETFIDVLVAHGPVILFSAAMPFQGGVDHVNERWPAYWAALFDDRGYVAVDCLRRKVWGSDKVKWWYAQNILMFVKRDCIADYPALEKESEHSGVSPLALVHPALYLEHARKTTLRSMMKKALVALMRLTGTERMIRNYLKENPAKKKKLREYFSRGYDYTGKDSES